MAVGHVVYFLKLHCTFPFVYNNVILFSSFKEMCFRCVQVYLICMFKLSCTIDYHHPRTFLGILKQFCSIWSSEKGLKNANAEI